MNQCKAIHYKKKQYKKKYYRDNVPNKQKKNPLSFRTPICHYNGTFLMAWSNKNNYNKNNA